MTTIKDFMEAVGYRITEGSAYTWDCFGPNAYGLTSWSGDNDTGHSVEIVFDNKTQVVYEVSAADYKAGKAYRITNPDYALAYQEEAKSRGIDPNECIDDIKYVDMNWDDTTFFDLVKNLVGFPKKETLTVDLEHDILFEAAMAAHDRDITLNQFFEYLLRNVAKDRLK